MALSFCGGLSFEKRIVEILPSAAAPSSDGKDRSSPNYAQQVKLWRRVANLVLQKRHLCWSSRWTQLQGKHAYLHLEVIADVTRLFCLRCGALSPVSARAAANGRMFGGVRPFFAERRDPSCNREGPCLRDLFPPPNPPGG